MKHIPVAPKHLGALADDTLSVRGMSANAKTLADFVSAREYEPGENLAVQGKKQTEILFITEGEVSAWAGMQSPLSGESSKILEINRMGPWELAGEVSMVTRLPATATLRAETTVRTLVLRHSDIDGLLKADPSTGQALLRRLAENTVEKLIRVNGGASGAQRSQTPQNHIGSAGIDHQTVDERLRELVAFQWSDFHITPRVISAFNAVNVSAGQDFITPGQTSDSLLLLVNGIARVSGPDGPVRGYEGSHNRVEHIVLGEGSFLTGAPRGALVTAMTDCSLVELPAAALPSLAAEAPAFTERLLRGLLHAVGRKLIDSSTMRTRAETVLGGDFDMWFMAESEFPLQFGE